ncbi:MAG TPA: carboxymuconolactone decarboxylase family protein [Candidatus Acidoferrales bacterium]|nr:carboxymuconolactone decarboxylase family protein [Candidatus Acidoferrales bacterium]
MQARMKNPVMFFPEALHATQELGKSAEESGLDPKTLGIVHLRASQINGCSVCVDLSYRYKKPGETEERLAAVAAWRDAPYFTDAERAALALAEAVTRMSDRSNPVPDDIWNEAKRHFDERELAALILWIATTNVWNRVNVSTRQVAGEWAKSADAKKWAEKTSVAR